MIRGLVRFHRGIFKMPVMWQLWLMLLSGSNLIVPLFFVGRFEARLVLGVMLLNAFLMVLLTGFVGFVRLLGLAHFPWLVLLAVLWARLDAVPADDTFGVWIRFTMAINAISLALDVADVIRYLRGERAETVELPPR